ncbi:DUF58 domain-containing protein [Woodsholea maritima]|uniref:DUF58 domain-containing protein n=1 Tax=Woodsholea maritima TaxID=240237 RepID=UPI00036CDAA6|nr:DUF58 domain-containing protein [Woodsholea maritima]
MLKRDRFLTLRQAADQAAAPFPALMVEADQIAASLSVGIHGRRRAGLGEGFWQYRPYHHEDPASAIDWRRSAQGDHVYVRETEWEIAHAVWFWRDGRPGMDVRSTDTLQTKKDRATLCLMALAKVLERGGERLGVLDETRRLTQGRAGLEQVCHGLYDSAGAIEPVERAGLNRHSRVILASDFLDPPDVWARRLKSLQKEHVSGVLLRLIDPSEDDFPFIGRTRFRDPSGADQPLLLGDAREARADYHARWQRHGEALQALAHGHGFQLITHRSDRPATQAVMALHACLSGGR